MSTQIIDEAERLKVLMIERDWSIEEMAVRFTVSVRSITRWLGRETRMARVHRRQLSRLEAKTK